MRNIIGLVLFAFAFAIAHSQTYRGEKAEWVLQIGGPSNDVSSMRVSVDNDGNAIIAGSFTKTLQIGKISLSADSIDAFLAKVSPKGDVLWVIKIGGENVEQIDYTPIVFDSHNNMHLCFYPSSKSVTVGDTSFTVDARPYILRLTKDGEYSRLYRDMALPNRPGWVRLATDDQDNFYCASVSDGIGILHKIDRNGTSVFTNRFSPKFPEASGRDLCCTPRVQTQTVDTDGNIYTAMLGNGPFNLNDTVVNSGYWDVVLTAQDKNGRIKWIRNVNGPSTVEQAFQMSLSDNQLHVWGEYGSFYDYPFDSTTIIDFGGQSLDRRSTTNSFHAVYGIDGRLVSVTSTPLVYGDHGPRLEINEYARDRNVTLQTAPGYGLSVIKGSVVERYYPGLSYALKSICGDNYLLGQFVNSINLSDGKWRLTSRGGQDIFLALMKPPTKYVPVRPGLRFPVDSAADLDLPVQVDWWWVGCANGYRLQIGRDSAMTQVVFDTTYALQPPYTLKNLEHSTKYFWRVRANTADTFSVWSDVRSFTTVKAQPADVVLEYPGNGSRGMQRQVTLRWTASKRASSYLVDVASDSAFANRVVNGKLVSTNALDVTLDANRTYYWRVRAGNSAGSSPWSAVWKFDVRPNTPERTILDKPLNGAQQEPINTVFGWLSQGDGLEYRLHVARDSAFGFIDIDKTTSNAYCQGTLEPSTTYFWRVRASNGYDDGAWSPTWSFSTGTTTSVNEDDSNPNVRVSYADGALLIHLSEDLQQQRSLAVSLFDLSGRQLISTIADNTGSPLRIAVPNLAHGTYVLRIGEEKGEMMTVQLQVR